MKISVAEFALSMSKPENWKKTKKRPCSVWARRVSKGVTIYNIYTGNIEESTDERCIMITGVVNESYLISEEQLKRDFLDVNNKPIRSISDSWELVKLNSDFNDRYMAIQCPIEVGTYPVKQGNTTVYANNAKTTGHGLGDYIVAYAMPNDVPDMSTLRVVNCSVFKSVYDMHEFGEPQSFVAVAKKPNN